MKKSFLPAVILGVGTLCLSSCADCCEQVSYKPVVAPTLKQMRHTLIDQLRNEGVQVIQLGETMRFVVKSDSLFNPDSANLRGEYKPVLNTIARLSRTYQKVNFKVAAYTDNRGNTTRQQALTTRQAQVVADYLWSRGIDARLAYAVGYNHQNPVAPNNSAKWRSDNCRLEISFRYYPPVPYV